MLAKQSQFFGMMEEISCCFSNFRSGFGITVLCMGGSRLNLCLHSWYHITYFDKTHQSSLSNSVDLCVKNFHSSSWNKIDSPPMQNTKPIEASLVMYRTYSIGVRLSVSA